MNQSLFDAVEIINETNRLLADVISIGPEQAAAEAIARADAHADPKWKEEARSAIDWACAFYHHFTTDQVWEFLDQRDISCHEPRALGALIRQAQAQGKIVATGEYRKSERSECHGRPVMVWRSI